MYYFVPVFLLVSITMKPKNTGFFNEIVTVKCNVNNLLEVKVRGNVI